MPRWVGVTSRILAGVFGGYGLASLAAAACAIALPLARSEAVLTGMLLGIIVHACAVLWAFAAKRTLWAWAGIAIPAAVLALLMYAARTAGTT